MGLTKMKWYKNWKSEKGNDLIAGMRFISYNQILMYEISDLC